MGFETNVWLTVNRQCNLRCSWCYARHTNFSMQDDMPLEKAFSLIDMASDLHITHISLIGGEPTLYNNLIDIIKYAKKKNINCGLITNGIKLSDKEYLSNLKQAGLSSVGVSLKGYSAESFKQLTGSDKYALSIKAIENLSNNEIPFTVSMVIDHKNYSSFLKGISDAKQAGASLFYLSFEFDFSLRDFDFADDYDFSIIFKMIDTFINKYDELCKITDDKFILHQTFPLCIWDAHIIKKMCDNHQLYTSCQLLQKSGIIFDTKGNLIPCNALYDYVLGEHGSDFVDSKSLKHFLDSDYVHDFYKEVLRAPSDICAKCDKWDVCGGGCISNWLHYDFDTLISKYNEYKASKH